MSRLWATDPSGRVGRVDTDRRHCPSGRLETDPSAAVPLGELQVRTRDELPSAIRWRDAWHPVEHIALSWQLDLNWWGARVYRDYYKLLAAGMALVIYHDLLTDAWALQRVYD